MTGVMDNSVSNL